MKVIFESMRLYVICGLNRNFVWFTHDEASMFVLCHKFLWA